jgi:hypothetical protein
VREVLWFFDPSCNDPFAIDGRCLVRYVDGRVKQSVLPVSDARLGYAMAAHGVKVSRKCIAVFFLDVVGPREGTECWGQ